MSNFYESISYNMPETEFEIIVKFCFLLYPYLIFAKKICAQICTIFANFEAKRAVNVFKIPKMYLINLS
jgi:hypothetical protein